MDLKSLLSQGKSPAKDHYWALVIEPEWIQAGIWEIEGEKARVVSVSPPAAWEVDEEMIGAADTALSAAIQNLPEEIGEPSKTVFGVPTSWVSEGQIKAEFLEKIKRICSELSLDPTGFVVLPEALAHLTKSEEGTPLNAIVVGLGDESMEIAVFRLGNLVGTSLVARSVSIADDVAEGLARFAGSETLPSRLLLYDGKEGELEEARQTLLKVAWEEIEKVKFLHTPKIEIVSPDRKVMATALAGASEIGDVSSVESSKGEFLKGEESETVSEDVQNVTKPKEEVNAEELGFVIGEDVAKKAPVAPSEQIPAQEPAPTEAYPAQPKVGKMPSVGGFNSFFSRLKSVALSLLPTSIPGPVSAASGKRIFAIGGAALVALFVLGFTLLWYLSKATVVIYVSPKSIDEKTEVVFDTSISSADFTRKVLPAELLNTQVAGDKTGSTTGTKTIGDKAKGSVKIQNGTASNINLSAGTIIVSSGDLRFSTNSSASVSAALSPSQPGTATIDVTATDIGSQYNLAKDETFKVSNYPKAEVDAVAISDFSGGSSREISAVSDEDQKSLEKELTNELLEKAKDKLAVDLGEDKLFVAESINPEVTSRSFSNKVGDEASTLKLSLDLGVTAVAVDKKIFNDFARDVLKGKLPSGYVLRDEQLTVEYDLVDIDDGVYDMDATIGANLLPDLKLEEIKKNIAGRSPLLAENYLTSIPGFTRAEIKLKPNLPGKLRVLPRMTKNIQIEISAER
jgi:hypothetical protein